MFSALGWIGCCWEWSCTWAWCWLRALKIFVYEVIEITRQIRIKMLPLKTIIWWSNMAHKEATRVETQRVATTIYVRFKVTICLYLSPNNRASNLSTLNAVIVNKDAPHNTKLVMTAASFAYRKIPRCSRVQESKTFTVAQRGSATRPTKRSVVAKQRYKSLDGGWREDSL